MTATGTLRSGIQALAAIAMFANLAAAADAAEPKHPLKPLLWKVEGKGLEHPSYLFGTIHLGQGPVATLHPAAQKAFDAAGAVHTEVALDAASQQGMIPLMMRNDGMALSESIGRETDALLGAELKTINPELDARPFQALKTWYIAVMVSMLPDQLAGGKPLDLKLWENAAAAGKKTTGMEQQERQIKAFNDLTEPEQRVLLSETLKLIKRDREKGVDPIKTLTDAYISGEPEAVVAEMDKQLLEMKNGDHKELGERLMRQLIGDRDKIMADYIIRTLKADAETVHFFAAGAAHFCPDQSIRSHLEKAGYSVTRIER